MNRGLIYISGLAHFCCQSLFHQRSKYKNWKSAFPWGLNKGKKINKWVSFLLLYLSTTTRLAWILAVCNQSLVYCNNTAVLPHSLWLFLVCFPLYHKALWYPKLSLPYARKITRLYESARGGLFLTTNGSDSRQQSVPRSCNLPPSSTKLNSLSPETT